jgi:hypothetical protein
MRHLTTGCRRTGGQRRYATLWPSQRSVEVLPPPLNPEPLGCDTKSCESL